MKPLTHAHPHAIIMLGIPGSGKSTFAERFAETFHSPILNIGKLQRELGLTDEAVDTLQDTILPELLKTRSTILIDGGLNRRAKRAEFVRTLAKTGYQPLVVWVQTDTAEAMRRALKEYPAGSGLTAEGFEAQVHAFLPPLANEKTVVISGKHTYATQLKIVLKQLALGAEQDAETVPPSTLSDDQFRPRGRGIAIR